VLGGSVLGLVLWFRVSLYVYSLANKATKLVPHTQRRKKFADGAVHRKARFATLELVSGGRRRAAWLECVVIGCQAGSVA